MLDGHPPLPGLSVVFARRGTAAPSPSALALGDRAAAAVAARHEVIVAEREPYLTGATDAAQHEWLALVDGRDASVLYDLPRCVAATPGHGLVVGRAARLQRPAPVRRSSHMTFLLPPSRRRRASASPQDLPLCLLRTDLARRLGAVAGYDLPAADLAVLAVLLDEPVAIVRVGASAVSSQGLRRAPRAA